MAETTVQEDVKQFIEYFKEPDVFVEKFDQGKLSTNDILKDIPDIVLVMLISAFVNDSFYKIIEKRVSKPEVDGVRFIVQKLERFGTKIIRESQKALAEEDTKKEERKLHGEITDISVTPFYDFDAKRNKIRLMFFCDKEKLTDSTISFEKCLSLSSNFLSGLDDSLKAVEGFDPKLLPAEDDLKLYKERLERVGNFTHKIASRLKIALETAKPEEKTEKIT
jgi:hypothetical protein